MLQTALHDWHIAAGGRMVEFAGWHMPIQYSSIVEEHNAVREKCGLFDIAHMGRLWFSGPDAITFLDKILTNHVAQLSPGQVRYSLVCRDDGGILDDVLIYRFEDQVLLVVNASNREKIVDWVAQQSADFDFKFEDATTTTFMLALQGPQAQTILGPHVNVDIAGLGYYKATHASAFGHDAVISRTGYTGEDGFELIVNNAAAADLWSQLTRIGADAGLQPCGLGCRDTLRLEAAMPLYGHEMDESVDPVTAGLMFGVKLGKEAFIGKSAIEAKKAAGPQLVRVGIELSGRRIAREGATLISDDLQVGHITSGTFSPTLQKSIAMGYIHPSRVQSGTVIEVDVRGKREPATIVPLPFYKRES